MNYFTKDNLIKKLKGITDFLELKFNNNAAIIISEYGGRPLGIFPRRNTVNLLWVNSDLSNQISQRSRDIGGDRYWLSPERTFFYKNPELWEEWFCPKGLDPAHYKIVKRSDKSCVLKTPISVQNQWNGEIYKGNITRTIELLDEPIKTGIDYCGIEYTDECILNEPNLKVNGWSLATVISGGVNNPGTVLIPTKSDPKPISYFRTIPKKRLYIGNNYVAYKIDVNDIYKLAIRPEDVDFSKKSKIAYALKVPNSEEYSILMKLSNDIPKSQNNCFDTARDHPDAEIGVIQSYNSESPSAQQLRYGEIELQLNKFKNSNGKSQGKATHQLIAYIGNKKEILDIIQNYLGIHDPQLF